MKPPGLTWEQVCADPNLRNLPYKVETNRYGQIIMSPAWNPHSRLQNKVSRLLDELMFTGEASIEFALETDDGFKVPDVIWMSDAFIARHGGEAAAVEAPEIVVEVLSESNSPAEMRKKARLFFTRGAKEFWLVGQEGHVRFFTGVGQEVAQSALCPAFPAQIKPGRRP